MTTHSLNFMRIPRVPRLLPAIPAMGSAEPPAVPFLLPLGGDR